MAKEFSFDIVCNIEMQMVKNAIQQTMKEVRQRFDFKGTKSNVTLDDNAIVLISEDDYRLNSIIDILKSRLFKSGVSLKALEFGKIEPAAQGMVRQKITLQQGIPPEKAKEIVKIVKQTKRKVQGQIQKDQVRISGKKKDDLQAIIKLLEDRDLKIDMQFVNFR